MTAEEQSELDVGGCDEAGAAIARIEVVETDARDGDRRSGLPAAPSRSSKARASQ